MDPLDKIDQTTRDIRDALRHEMSLRGKSGHDLAVKDFEKAVKAFEEGVKEIESERDAERTPRPKTPLENR